jgi:hypothetical protein
VPCKVPGRLIVAAKKVALRMLLSTEVREPWDMEVPRSARISSPAPTARKRLTRGLDRAMLARHRCGRGGMG